MIYKYSRVPWKDESAEGRGKGEVAEGGGGRAGELCDTNRAFSLQTQPPKTFSISEQGNNNYILSCIG